MIQFINHHSSSNEWSIADKKNCTYRSKENAHFENWSRNETTTNQKATDFAASAVNIDALQSNFDICLIMKVLQSVSNGYGIQCSYEIVHTYCLVAW